MGKPCFRVDTSTDFAEIGDDGKPYWIRADESRELVTGEQARKLIEAARGYGFIDPLEGTSLRALQNNELTIGGSLFGLGMDEEGDLLGLDQSQGEEGREKLVREACNVSGASAETFKDWSAEKLRTLVREARKLEIPEGTSAHPSVWGRKLTVGDLSKREEPE